LRCATNAGEGRLFVNMSATILCVCSGISSRIPALTISRIKYHQISMYRENFRRIVFLLIAIHARLSSKISFAADCWYRNLGVCHADTLPCGLCGCLRRKKLLMSTERRYLVGHLSMTWVHHLSSNCSLCVVVGCLCCLPNQHRSTPTNHLFDSFRACTYYDGVKGLPCIP